MNYIKGQQTAKDSGLSSLGYAAPIGSDRATPVSLLETSITSCERGLNEISDAVDSLEVVLRDLMRPAVPVPPGCESNVATQEHSVVIECLHDQRAKMEQLVNRLNGIRARLDA
jgi:hypothetical protein